MRLPIRRSLRRSNCHELRTLPATVRGQNTQNDSPSRLEAGSSAVATRTWWPRLCSMKKCP